MRNAVEEMAATAQSRLALASIPRCAANLTADCCFSVLLLCCDFSAMTCTAPVCVACSSSVGDEA